MRITTALCTFLMLGVGCVAGDALDIESEHQEVIGGDPDVNNFRAACIMDIERPDTDEGDPRVPIVCSCVLIESRTVLTAASCVVANAEEDDEGMTHLGDITLRFGTDRSGDPIVVESAELYRYFDVEASAPEDIALLRLAADPPEFATPVVIGQDPLGSEDVGEDVTLVGYGATNEQDEGSTGVRYAVDTPIVQVAQNHIVAGTNEATTCAGDSGGPVFMDRGDGNELVAVTSFNGLGDDSTDCSTNVRRMRVDHFAEDFILQYIRRFDETCPLDGTCDEEVDCGGFEDLDCDPCSWDGTCEEDCPTRDWDCEIGVFVGDACEKSGDCERGGRCVPAVDDESFTFCTQPCDLEAATEQCPMGMTCADDGSGGGECVWEAPSPGSQGYACSSNDDCRSGICEDMICVFECDPGLGEDACAEPFVCGPSKVADGTNVCLGENLSGGGGFCAMGEVGGRSSGAGGATALFAATLLGAGLVLRRRRRE